MIPVPANLDEAVMEARQAVTDIRTMKHAAMGELARTHHRCMAYRAAIQAKRDPDRYRDKLEFVAVKASDLQIMIDEYTARERIILDALRAADVHTDL